jgi:hypothetical protein
LLDGVAGAFLYNVKLEQGATDLHRSRTDACLLINEPIKRVKDRERVHRFRLVESVVLLGLIVFTPVLMVTIRVILPVIIR